MAIPSIPETFYGEHVTVKVDVNDQPKTESAKILPSGKTAIEDFLNFCKELNLPPMTDEEVEQAKFDYLKEKYK